MILWRRIKAWWSKYRPIISRKEFDDMETRYKYQLSSSRRENDDERKKLTEILGTYTRMKVERLPEYRWGLTAKFSEEVINRFAVYDTESIRYLARMLSRKIEEELMSINFARVGQYAEWYSGEKWKYFDGPPKSFYGPNVSPFIHGK